MHYSFAVSGAPRGKARARTVFRGGKAHAFTPARTRDYEEQVRLAYMVQTGQTEPFHGPVELTLRAYYPIPSSWPKGKSAKALARLLLPTVKPDLDNVLKSIMDAVNGLAWDDDKQVVMFKTSKEYSANPRVEVEIWEVNG